MQPPLVELGGNKSGTVLNFAVANGFPPEVYTPMLRPLMDSYRVVSLLPRALWGGADTTPPEALIGWQEGTTRDLSDGLRAHHLRDVIAVGHSFGGIASMLAAVEDPSRFKALIVLDPTIVIRDFIAALQMARETGTTDQIPPVARALKRQRDFDSVEAAYTYFKGKSLFADWDDEGVQLYAQHGTRPLPDGRVTLAWTPEWEAYVFKTGTPDTWNLLPQLRGLLPTLIVRGGTSDTFVSESAEEVREILPDAVYAEVAGHGHLFPLSNPGETARIIQNFLDNLS